MMPRPGDRPQMRASDAERDRTIEALRDHCAQGRLTLEEFAERLDVVLTARTRDELDTVTADLPVPRLQQRRDPRPVVRRAEVPQAGREAGLRKRFIAIMGSSSRTERWRVPERADVLAIMGDCSLDLREASFDGDEIEMSVVAVMGDVRIVVPEGMQVELTGWAVMGDNTCRTDQAGVLSGLPSLRIRAFTLMGDVNVRARPRRALA